MKELSIEEKAKAYDEAIEELRGLLEGVHEEKCEIMEEDIIKIFPELKESEDERIRKALMQNLKERFGTKGNMGEGLDMPDVLTWLEKQGEQKSVVIIPKFRIGDEIKTSNEESLTITKIDEKGYWSEDLFICDFGDAAKWELVEQKTVWSKEDETKINYLIALLQNCTMNNDALRAMNEGIEDWLNSLKDKVQSQLQWKPSDEQMMYLSEAIDVVTRAEKFSIATALKELREQLKKLK